MISVLALLVAGAAAVYRPGHLDQIWGFLWVLALVPAFLLTYYRGLVGAATALAAGMAALTLTELVAGNVVHGEVDWRIYAVASVVLLVTTLGTGFVSEFLQRSGGDPHLARRHIAGGREVRRALKRDEFVLYVQPVVAVGSGRVAGIEGHLWWDHPESGPLPPNLFLGSAEATELGIPLARTILIEAARAFSPLQEALGNEIFMSLDLSPALAAEPERLQELVLSELGDRSVAADAFRFELPEASLEASAEGVRRLRSLGSRVVVDDFGAGGAPLEAFRWIELDGLNLASSLVEDLGSNPRADAVVAAVLELARRLDLASTALGVTTRRQMRTLEAEGCDYAQGLLHGDAVPLAEFLSTARARDR